MSAEHLPRRPKSQALARRVIQPVTQGAELLIADIQHDRFRRQISSNPLVRVLHRAFLPWSLWVAEPSSRSHAVLELAP